MWTIYFFTWAASQWTVRLLWQPSDCMAIFVILLWWCYYRRINMMMMMTIYRPNISHKQTACVCVHCVCTVIWGGVKFFSAGKKSRLCTHTPTHSYHTCSKYCAHWVASLSHKFQHLMSCYSTCCWTLQLPYLKYAADIIQANLAYHTESAQCVCSAFQLLNQLQATTNAS